MKLYGVFGKGSGKVGNSVWAISGGEQIVRPYNPNVTNPNTDAQVAQRAKLKLMSQLAAALAPAIAFKKQGLVSARNQFVSKNIGLCTYDNDEARIRMDGLQFTPSSKNLPNPSTTGVTEQGTPVKLASTPSADVKAVVYVAVGYVNNNQITSVEVKAVTAAGEDGAFPTTMAFAGGDGYLYAYGITDASAVGKISYGDYAIDNGVEEAILGVVTSLIQNASSFTATKALSL